MRFAYADPPYPGQAKRYYGSEPTYAGEVYHVQLIGELGAYDGWALSTRTQTLSAILRVCPDDVRVAVWHKPDAPHPGHRGRWWWLWEPVIVKPARLTKDDLGPVVADVLRLPWTSIGGSTSPAKVLTGQKSGAFCQWVLDLIGYRDGDTIDDLYPGSGVMGRAAAQGRFALGVSGGSS